MFCPYCASPTTVTNSRPQQRINGIWRRRKCLSCSKVLTSQEQYVLDQTWVVADADGDQKPFSRDKLFISLYEALRHRESDALTAATHLCDTVIKKLTASKQSTLPTELLRKTCHQTLKRFDAYAAHSYVAYHH